MGETAFDPMFVDDAIEQAVAVAKLGERTAALVEDARLVAPRRALSSALAAAEPNALVVDAAATATLRALDAVLLDALAQRSDRIGTFDCVGARLALAIALGDLDDALENAAATFAEDEHESERENDLDEERAETREAALDAWSTWRDEARVRGLDVVTATPVAVGATPPSNEAFVFPEVVTALARATSACAHKPPIRT
ncbi:MAG: hypothetical protein ACKV2T_16855 [Kofleriaceae bacterium]